MAEHVPSSSAAWLLGKKKKKEMSSALLISIGQIPELPGILSLSEENFPCWSEGVGMCVGF